ncbi:hypothetical protein B0H19DRAFT_1094369 [Mycena capillaripes]|nr:hypothetical protein B0H19DRAFT_1094369 [Mycena capillaripes]
MSSEDERNAWLSRLSKKTTLSMYHLLRANEDETVGMPSMKWENFLMVVRGIFFFLIFGVIYVSLAYA